MKTALAIGAILLAACLPSLAQNSSMVSADIPFPFYVGHLLYPAGHYTFNSVGEQGEILAINGSTARYHLMTTAKLTERIKDGKLVFCLENGKYYLHQVWVSGDMHWHDIQHQKDVPEVPKA